MLWWTTFARRAPSRSWPRPACVTRRTCSRRCSTASRTAGPGLPSTSSPHSSPRVIGAFEESIARLVALAALMPIVAGIGGNSGNQTITMIVRSIALGQVQREHAKKLLAKELGVSLLNGLIWGSALGLIAYWLYQKVSLGLVMTAAMTLNLVLAATAGVLIPLTMIRLGRDPALGSSVLITAITDSGGFFIFLGLATLFLV